MNNWVVVLDDDDVSRRQMQVCQLLKPPLKGAIECHLEENADASACNEVTHFPAFCHVETGECLYGLRTSLRDMEALAETPITEPPAQHTRYPTPPQETTPG